MTTLHHRPQFCSVLALSLLILTLSVKSSVACGPRHVASDGGGKTSNRTEGSEEVAPIAGREPFRQQASSSIFERGELHPPPPKHKASNASEAERRGDLGIRRRWRSDDERQLLGGGDNGRNEKEAAKGISEAKASAAKHWARMRRKLKGANTYTFGRGYSCRP